ncbi:hypothetical protein [Micromonospora costi]|uniref:Uncharacterized protein n=1 Tax=Micromonospora costi TaxID=1530042 RepID=A0A3B0A2G2_9ACTN|nr:hypothetical protein [Micromonospora costi]RKN54692.1 hypothetical protein D7193_20695 [Micromonospora costi]
MRGGLDETLARMARREEALRRAAGPAEQADREPGAQTDREPDAQGGREPDAQGRREPDAQGGREPGAQGGREPGAHRLDGDRATAEDPVEAVVEAVRRVVAEHPGLAVTVRVEQGGQAYPLRVAWSGDEVTVAAELAPPPTWPVSGRNAPSWPPGRGGTGHAPAARLAELIRRDPSLLTDHDR